MEELEQIKKRFESKNDALTQDVSFNEWHRIYRNTNENLAGYMKELEGKKVLTVAASGDYKLNAINLGAVVVDTFDINRIAPLYQELKVKAIQYLDIESALQFLYEMDKETYKEFNSHLSITAKEVFDYLFNNFSINQIYDKLFDHGRCLRSNNTYFNGVAIRVIKEKLEEVKSMHYSCNVYSLPYMLNRTYDTIYLSNISQYEDASKYLSFLRTLRHSLTDDGKIYFGYSYSTTTDDLDTNLHLINGSYSQIDKDSFEDLYKDMDVEIISGASGNVGDIDAVISLKK